MSEKSSLSIVPKSSRRTWIIDQLLDAMKSDEIFHTIDYRKKKESYIKQYMHQIIKRRLVEIHRHITPKGGSGSDPVFGFLRVVATSQA